MSTSNHSWNAGDRPALYVTPAGIELLAYLDYVTVHNFASLAPGDTSIPEQYDDERQPPERKDVTPHVDEWQPEDAEDNYLRSDDLPADNPWQDYDPEED